VASYLIDEPPVANTSISSVFEDPLGHVVPVNRSWLNADIVVISPVPPYMLNLNGMVFPALPLL